MKFKHHQFGRGFLVASNIAAIVSTLALLSGTLGVALSAQTAETGTGHITARLTEEQRILHVLNRLGFGARPGDIARVKAMGLDNYVSQQLSPEKISDAIAEAKL
ncbi:MAG: DUF1800 domain-containing protein, partial [Acidobacteriota bacterium]|nr:DUF1800 domain-containing protein [Acidobacteriota bacterium]